MPDAKLTLKLDRDAIALGKRLAKERGVSLSRLVEGFLRRESEAATSARGYSTYEEGGKTYVKNRWGLKLEEPSWYKYLERELPPDYDIKDYILERYG